MLKKLKSILKDERGFEIVEWVVLGTIVAGMAVAGGTAVYGYIHNAADTIGDNLNNVVSASNVGNASW